jgi:hypothetical protein
MYSEGSKISQEIGLLTDSGFPWYYSVPPIKCQDIISIRSRTLPSRSYRINYSPIILHPALSISMSLQPFVAPLPLFSFLILYTLSVGLFGWGISPSQCRYIYTGQNKQNKRTQTSMPRVGFEPMTPVFERAKTVYALDRAATVSGHQALYSPKY